MTSTRNKNTQSDYNIHVHQNKNIEDNKLFKLYTRPYNEAMTDLGYRPSYISRDSLSNNPIDIESSLFGIGSTNLVQPQQPIYPSLRNLETIKFFERPNEVIMPQPLIINNDQRPFII